MGSCKHDFKEVEKVEGKDEFTRTCSKCNTVQYGLPYHLKLQFYQWFRDDKYAKHVNYRDYNRMHNAIQKLFDTRSNLKDI